MKSLVLYKRTHKWSDHDTLMLVKSCPSKWLCIKKKKEWELSQYTSWASTSKNAIWSNYLNYLWTWVKVCLYFKTPFSLVWKECCDVAKYSDSYLGICALHLSNSNAHTQSSGQSLGISALLMGLASPQPLYLGGWKHKQDQTNGKLQIYQLVCVHLDSK